MRQVGPVLVKLALHLINVASQLAALRAALCAFVKPSGNLLIFGR